MRRYVEQHAHGIPVAATSRILCWLPLPSGRSSRPDNGGSQHSNAVGLIWDRVVADEGVAHGHGARSYGTGGAAVGRSRKCVAYVIVTRNGSDSRAKVALLDGTPAVSCNAVNRRRRRGACQQLGCSIRGKKRARSGKTRQLSTASTWLTFIAPLPGKAFEALPPTPAWLSTCASGARSEMATIPPGACAPRGPCAGSGTGSSCAAHQPSGQEPM